MAIRLGNSCVNCESLSADKTCKTHMVKVSNSYTCDSFHMKSELIDNKNCVTCLYYEANTCHNPQTAAPGMLCYHWAPLNAAS